MTLSLRLYQREAIDDTRKRWNAGAVRVPLVLATGLGKGHPLDTDVPTPDGWRKWGDLAPGDYVFGSSGEPTRVTRVSDRGILPSYRVTMSDGSSVVVDGDHLWTVRDSGQSYRPWITASTADLAGASLKRARGWRFHIPMPGRVRNAESSLPIGAYTVGALIANGGMTVSGTSLTTPDAWVAERVRADGFVVNKASTPPGTCDRYHVTGVTQATRKLGMRVHSKLKRIPPAYLTASVADRIHLLNGLMDGDGAKRDRARRSVSYFTSSRGLAEDVSELVTSLGGTGIVKAYDRGEKGVEYAVRILLPSGVPAFSQGRKSDNGSESIRNLQPKRAIVSIEPVGEREIRCIAVDASDSLYLITRQHIVTHNSVIAASLISEWMRDSPGKRTLVIAHTDELIDQLYRKVLDVAPHLRAGIVKGTKNQVLADVIVSSRQTLAYAKRREPIRDVGLIIIDECHHSHRANTYGKILEHFGAFDPDSGVKTAGFTATLVRGDKRKLSSVWEDCTFARDIRFGIRNGYLLDIQGARIVVPGMNASSVAMRGGDYDAAALAEELDRTFAIETIAKQYAEIAADRKTIAFWPLVATAEHAAEVFNDHGIRSGHVSGAMDKTLRRQTLADLRSGKLACVHNAMVLTEGFDDPSVDCVLVGRRTVSPAMGPQMAGRGMRPPLWIPPTQRRPMLLIDAVGAFDADTLQLMIDLSPERARIAEQLDLDTEALTLEERESAIDAALAAEMDEQRAGASFEFEADEYRGATEVVAFDPLGRDAVWAVTPAGTHYVKAGGDAYVFVVPSLGGDPGAFDVVACSKKDSARVQGWQRGTAHAGLSFELALGWAESEALEIGGCGAKTLGARKSRWRNRAVETGSSQEHHAKSLGVWRDGMTAGECSDAIDAVYAARRIDPLVARVMSRV